MAKGKLYGLTKADRDQLRKTVREVRGGTGMPSKRPTATRRRPSAPGSGKKHEFLRLTVGSYNPTTKIVVGTGTPLNLPSGSKAAPEGTIKAYDAWGISPSAADVVVLVYSENFTTIGEDQIDWLVLPFEGDDTTKTLLFKLYENPKHRTNGSFQAKFCKADKTVFGNAFTIYDPFAGTGKGFSAGHHEDAFGRATLERDAETQETRFVVTHLESIKTYAVGVLAEDFGYDVTDAMKCDSYFAWGHDLHHLAPTSDIYFVGDDTLHGHLKAGDKVMGILYDADGEHTTYE